MNPQSMARKGFTDCVRRKRWVRGKQRIEVPQQQTDSHSSNAISAGSDVEFIGVVQPGAKLPLPLDWATNGRQLQVCKGIRVSIFNTQA